MCNDPKFGHAVAEEFELISEKLDEVFDFTRKLVRHKRTRAARAKLRCLWTEYGQLSCRSVQIRYGTVKNATAKQVVVKIRPSGREDEKDPFFLQDISINIPFPPKLAFKHITDLMSICAQVWCCILVRPS